MDKREVQEIMSEGAIRPETAQDRRERELLREELDTSPVKGKPLRQRLLIGFLIIWVTRPGIVAPPRLGLRLEGFPDH